MRNLTISVCIAVVVTLTGAAMAGDIKTGRFTFSAWDGPALNVYFVEPDREDLGDAPVVIVFHGVRRNADDYARNWRRLVSEYGVRVYAPEFSQQSFPRAAMYNLGGLGTDGPSSYAAIEPLYADILSQRGDASGYYLFGHSAGAQVVHRALLFEELPNLQVAYAANAGWYTMPDLEADWPYGLAGTPADERALRKWLQKPLMVLLGEEDTDSNDRNLRRTPEANAQGPHRFARGVAFLNAANDRAVALGVPLAWRGGTVPGVAHDNEGMAFSAAPLIAAHAAREQEEPE